MNWKPDYLTEEQFETILITFEEICLVNGFYYPDYIDKLEEFWQERIADFLRSINYQSVIFQKASTKIDYETEEKIKADEELKQHLINYARVTLL